MYSWAKKGIVKTKQMCYDIVICYGIADPRTFGHCEPVTDVTGVAIPQAVLPASQQGIPTPVGAPARNDRVQKAICID